MMREFKFIRGIYKNESVLSQDEIRDTLFALYGDGSSISLDAKNDEDFQEKIVGLESDNREIYTIRPSQFKVRATLQSDDKYLFTYDLDGNVYDNSMAFPPNIKTAAASHLSKNITANIINGTPSLIISDYTRKSTPVSFTFNNGETFTRDLYFEVSGEIEEFTHEKAKSANTTAYKITEEGIINFNDYTNGAFFDGRLQNDVPYTQMKVAPYYEKVDEYNYNKLNVASKYTVNTSEYMFLYNNGLSDYVMYKDDLNFKLYKKVNEYLVIIPSKEALNGSILKKNCVAYLKTDCPGSCYNESLEDVYIYSEDSCIKDNITQDIEMYDFFEIRKETAYIQIGECEVENRVNTLVKDYDVSFSELFIVEDDDLRNLKNEDLTQNASLDVYLKKETYYHIFDNGVYEDDPSNDKIYVTISKTTTEKISKSNATITNDNRVAPKQGDNTFRQIKNVYINATES